MSSHLKIILFVFLQVMPGLLLCFVLRYDRYKKQAAAAAETEQSKITYFHCSLIGYIVGKSRQMPNHDETRPS